MARSVAPVRSASDLSRAALPETGATLTAPQLTVSFFDRFASVSHFSCSAAIGKCFGCAENVVRAGNYLGVAHDFIDCAIARMTTERFDGICGASAPLGY